MKDNTIGVFFALLKAGLWENLPVQGEVLMFRGPEPVDWNKVYQLAEDQSVMGVALAGIERLKNANHHLGISQELLLQWIGEVQIIEQQNKAMNKYITELVENMRKVGIYTLLVKGQGIAQCYERPLWRTTGDIDFFLSEKNYLMAKQYLISQSPDYKPESVYSKEFGIEFPPYYIELHGSLRTGLAGRIDKEIDAVQRDVFYGGNVRSWNNESTQIFLPSPDNDVFLVFTHFIKHFYKEGGKNLRQICDWCRLLWVYRSNINVELLQNRLQGAGLMSEWKSFAALAVDKLGMPAEAMPLYDERKKWLRKAEKIAVFMFEGGKWERMKDTLTVAKIFPINTIKFLPAIFFNVNVAKLKEWVLMRLKLPGIAEP